MASILVVDDSAFQRMALKKIIQGAGHKVLEAANGQQGLELIASKNPDLVVIDLLMPELDGVGLLEQCKIRGIHVPIVVLTSDIQESTRQRCQELGAAAFLNKPVEPVKLKDIFDNYLA